MLKRSLRNIAITIVLCCFGEIAAFSQFDELDSKVRSILTSSELGPIEKTDKIHQKAEDLEAKANEKLIEVYTLEASEEAQEKKIQNKINVLKIQALDMKTQAAELHIAANEQKLKAYNKIVADFWEDNEWLEEKLSEAKIHEELSKNFSDNAEGMIKEAKSTKSTDDNYIKLSQANDYYKMSLESLYKSILIIYELEEPTANNESPNTYNEPTVQSTIDEPVNYDIPETINTETYSQTNYAAEQTDAIIDSIQVNSQLLSMYQQLLNDPSYNIRDSIYYLVNQGYSFDYIINRLSSVNTDNNTYSKSNINNESQVDNTIKEPATEPVASNQVIKSPPTMAKPLTSAVPVKTSNSSNTQTTETKTYSKAPSTPVRNTVTESTSYESVSSTPVKKSAADNYKLESTVSLSALSAGGDIIFTVQIAASKTLLNTGYLNTLYKGNKSIYVRDENGWYKYQIGMTNNIQKAMRISKNSGIDNAYVVAYQGDKQLNLVDASKASGLNNKDVQYMVQIAASRTPLSQNVLNRIYNGNFGITLTMEEGWYKYQINAGSDYNKASTIKSQIGVRDAFIVAYKEGEKTILYETIK